AITGDARRSEVLAGSLRELEASHFDYRADGLVRHGLLQRRTVPAPGGPPQTVLCVTLAGRTAIDRVVAFVGQAAAELPAASVAVEGAPAPQSRAQRRPERPATDTEALRLLAAAPTAFALTYRALRRLPVLVSELIAVDVEDVDLRNHGVRIRARQATLPVDRELWEIFRSAIGRRESGPAFIDAAGRPWNARGLSKAFRRL